MDKNNIKNYLISRVKDEEHAISYWKDYGPSFGNGDLTIYGGYTGEVSFNKDTKSYCVKKSYEKQIRKTSDKFSIEEYEVFQIIKVN